MLQLSAVFNSYFTTLRQTLQHYTHLWSVLVVYMTDKFGSLGSLLDVRTVGHCGVMQAGFGVLFVGNLWGWWVRKSRQKNIKIEQEKKVKVKKI